MIVKYLLILTLTTFSLLAENLDIEFNTILHTESETTLGKENNSSYPKESNNFSTLYGDISFIYDISDDFFISTAAKANYVLGEDTYETPLYLRAKLTSDDINRAVISELSLNYDNNFFSLNLGRSEVDYDWIDGSIDGVIAMVGSDDTYAMRLFWFNEFSYLQYNYYVNFKDINEKEGMYGAILSLHKQYFNISMFDYYMKDLRNFLGTSAEVEVDNFTLELNYTTAKALSLANYDYDESIFNLSSKYSYKRHSYEVGGSLTGENGLLAMVQLGSFMFGHFYLSNQVDRESAKNIFARYTYSNSHFQLKLLGGWTGYDNSFVRIENNLHSAEIDTYVAYAFTKDIMLDFGVMYMDVDERDPISISQTLLMTNLVYRYESF